MKQTVTSKYEPKSKNVTWIDMSTGHPVLKNFINGMWRPTGGSGSSTGSSNPTEADATKVWQVTPVQKGTKTEETVIVPEQTCQMEDNGKQTKCTLQNVDESFVPGFSGIVILDGVEYEIEWGESTSGFSIGGDSYCAIEYAEYENEYYLYDHNKGLTHTIKVITRETEPMYDYNWAPGVKIPIPTAEDEGKILVVTKTEEDTSTIVPEQPIVDGTTPLTNVDLTKFVVGNTVRVTIPENSETFTATGVIEEDGGFIIVNFIIDGTYCAVAQIDNLLYTNAGIEFNDSTIKLEYIEFNYEYQLQENSGGSEKVVTLENWAYRDNGGESILTDIEGNKFYEGQDFTIEYNTGVSSNNPFDRIKTISVGGNYQCDKIVIVEYSGVKYIKIPVYIFADSRGNNYVVFGSSDTNRIGTLVVG